MSAAALGIVMMFFGGVAGASDEEGFLDMPLEDLLDMEVVSAAKKEQKIGETPASVYIITREQIRRAGVNSVPEALRLAPGIQVARIDANKWAISSRGFGNQFANMLLVLIDGRTVYSPTMSGVYWDAQDVVLEDIERIEVIRGPGATLWGTNAVNGIVNIITRDAADTLGGIVVAGAGDEEKRFISLRYGAKVGDSASGRVYLKYNDRDSYWLPQAHRDADDRWRGARGGFRLDGIASPRDSWTLQGDIYDLDEHQLANYWADPSDPDSAPYAPSYVIPMVEDHIKSSGWNLLGRWEREFGGDSQAILQVYYDHTRRSEGFSRQIHDTLDIDFQHRVQPLAGHDVVWGINYRHIQDDFRPTFMASVQPLGKGTNLYSFFLQDEIAFREGAFRVILGSKFEHNDYTGLEIQPNLRLLWQAAPNTTLWGSVARAVRMPSRVERSADIVLQIVPMPEPLSPLIVHAYGNDDFVSEELLAWELGLRHQPWERLSLDLVAYYNDYHNLETLQWSRSNEGEPYVRFDNDLRGSSHGLELSLEWHPLEWWRLQLGYAYYRSNLFLTTGSTLAGMPPDENATPAHMASLFSAMDIGNDWSLDAWLYYSSRLDHPAYLREAEVPAWSSFNLRLGWRPTDKLEVALVGRNLFDPRHLEFVGESYLMPTEIERSIYAKFTWRF